MLRAPGPHAAKRRRAPRQSASRSLGLPTPPSVRAPIAFAAAALFAIGGLAGGARAAAPQGATAPRLEIRLVEAQSADESAQVRVYAARKPVWTARFAGDQTLDLWLAETVPGPGVGDVEQAKGLLAAVRVAAEEEDGGTRISIETRRPVMSSADWADGALTVALTPATGGRSRIEPAGTPFAVTASPCLNLRVEPDRSARAVDCLAQATAVSGGEADGEWTRVRLTDGRVGWVATRFLAPAPEEQVAAAAPAELAEAIAAAPSTEASAAPVAAPAPEPAAAAAQVAPSEPAADETEADEAARAALRIAELEARLARLAEERDALERRVKELEARLAAAAERSTRVERQLLEVVRERDELKRRTEAAAPAPTPAPPPAPVPVREPLPAGPAVRPPLAAAEETADEPTEEGGEPAAAPTAPAAAPPQPAEARPAGEEVAATVGAWAAAWSEQRVDDYLSFYAPGFSPGDGLDRAAWEAQRRQRLSRPRFIEVRIEALGVSVAGERATARFLQTYRSDRFSDRVTKVLELERRDGAWKILSERVEE